MTAHPERETSEWDRHTAVAPRDGGGYDVELTSGWVVGGGVNGGYLLACVASAVAEEVPSKPDPFVVSATYLSASVPGPAHVDVTVLRDGGSLAVVEAVLSQDGTPRLKALGTFGRLADLPDEVETTAEPLVLPPLDQCVPGSMAPAEVRSIAPMLDRFDMIFDPACVGWALGEPSGRGLIQAWFRLKEREPDPISLLMTCDALPPVTFDLGRPGWAPTLELSVHVRAVPAPGWLAVRHQTRNIAGGMFEEDCEVWDSAGRLVAQSRQLARLPRG